MLRRMRWGTVMRPMTDVVVLLPGITGSVLRDSRSRDLWAPTAGTVARALVTLGRSIADLELRDENADGGVTAPMMIPDLHLIPGLWKIDGYSKDVGLSAATVRRHPGQELLAFPMTGGGTTASPRAGSRSRPTAGCSSGGWSRRTPSSSWSLTRWAGWSPGTSLSAWRAGGTLAGW